MANHVPALSSHNSVTVNSVGVNMKNRKKNRKNAIRFCWCLHDNACKTNFYAAACHIDWYYIYIYIYIYILYIAKETYFTFQAKGLLNNFWKYFHPPPPHPLPNPFINFWNQFLMALQCKPVWCTYYQAEVTRDKSLAKQINSRPWKLNT